MTPTTPRTTLVASWVVLLGLGGALAGTAFAQAGPGSVAGGAAASTAPAAGDAQPPAPPPTRAADAGDARKACSDAMNADPQFAADVVKIAGERAMKDPRFAGEIIKLGDEAAVKKRDADTIKAHEDANHHIQRNERQVIYAYALMWIVAAGFVIFLWRRQRVLETEIAFLRRELEGAGNGPAGKGGT
jgi:hypothetical protein